MNERIIALRKYYGLNQTDFGERLGVSRSVIANLELGRVEPTEMFVRHLSRTFGARQEWLRTGEGEMLEYQNDEFNDVARQLNLNEFQRRMVQIIYEMPLEHQRLFRDYAVKLLAEDDAARVASEETEHERIERITNDHLDAYDAQHSVQKADEKA